MRQPTVFFLLTLLLYNACNSRQAQQNTPTHADTMALIDKYVLIYNTLQVGVHTNEATNQNRVDAWEYKKDTTNLYKVKKLHDYASFAYRKISLVKYFLFSNIGKTLDEKGYTIKNPVEIKAVENYMIGYNKNGEGYQLEKVLNEYTDFLNANFGQANRYGEFIPITKIYADNPLFKGHPELQKLDFVERRFKGSTNILAIMQLLQWQANVLYYETAVLDYLEKVK